MLHKSLWVRTFILHLGTDRLLRPRGEGGEGVQFYFFRGLIYCCCFFWGGGGAILKMHKMWGGWNFKTQDRLLCKICQTILWLKQIYVSFKSRQKISFGGSLSATKCYPYKTWPRNLSAISTSRNVACMWAHTSRMHTAEIWKKIYRFFLLPESIFIIKSG